MQLVFRFSLLVLAAWAVSLVEAQRAYPITGVPLIAPTSPVPLRKNINELYSAGGPTWDLYIRSLVEMYQQDPKDQLSYFQIAGIHGKPYIEWNGAGPRTSDGWRGYCPHGEPLFLPWHRPYVVLFEQRLVETAIKLAEKYPSNRREEYLVAAKKLRSPYWDWAESPNVPEATVPNKLRVSAPNGNSLRTIEVDNPLRFYKFPQAALNGEFGTFDEPENRPQIYKCRAPENYPRSANAAMAARSYKRWTYDAFTRSTTFDQFASTRSGGQSLEQIHNGIHWDGSCGYQFLTNGFSAFDPLFMLHHTNTDRLWAYWQAIRPSEASLKNSYSGGARFSSRSGTTITPDTPLHPFFANSQGRFHTPKSVQSIKGFNYAYEGLEYWKKSDSKMRTDATAIINKLYSDGVTRPMMLKRGEGDVGEVLEEAVRYFAQIQVDVEELERPCEIKVFVGDHLAGELIVLQQPEKGTVNGKFALDDAPEANPVDTHDDITEEVVEDILSLIKVEITKHDGEVIPLESVPSLKIELENVEVELPESDTELPEYHDADLRAAPKKQVDAAISKLFSLAQ